MQSHVCVLAASLTPVGLPSDLVIKGVMDEAWLADANSAFDRFATQPERIRLVPEAVLRENGHVWPEGSSPLLKGKPAPGPGQKEGEGAIHRPRMGGLYTLPDGHNAPFRKMIAHPKVVQRLNMMLGPGYQEAFEPMGCCYIPGTCGGSLHAGPRGGIAGNEGPLETGLSGTALGYGLANGRAYCEGVNVQWALGDATAAEGGCFVSLRPAWPTSTGTRSCLTETVACFIRFASQAAIRPDTSTPAAAAR